MIDIKVLQHHEDISFYYNCYKLHSHFNNYVFTMKYLTQTQQNQAHLYQWWRVTFEKTQFNSTNRHMV